MLVQLVAILLNRSDREESKHKSSGPPLPAAIIVMNIMVWSPAVRRSDHHCHHHHHMQTAVRQTDFKVKTDQEMSPMINQ